MKILLKPLYLPLPKGEPELQHGLELVESAQDKAHQTHAPQI